MLCSFHKAHGWKCRTIALNYINSAVLINYGEPHFADTKETFPPIKRFPRPSEAVHADLLIKNTLCSKK